MLPLWMYHCISAATMLHMCSSQRGAEPNEEQGDKCSPRRQRTPLMGGIGSSIPYWLRSTFFRMLLWSETLPIPFLFPQPHTIGARLMAVWKFSSLFLAPSSNKSPACLILFYCHLLGGPRLMQECIKKWFSSEKFGFYWQEGGE